MKGLQVSQALILTSVSGGRKTVGRPSMSENGTRASTKP